MTNFYQRHLFFCTNQKESGKACCANKHAAELAEYAKQQIKKRDLWGEGRVRVSQSGCLGRCRQGPALVIYPEAVWYTYRSEHDIDEIINQHLVLGQVVRRLELNPGS